MNQHGIGHWDLPGQGIPVWVLGNFLEPEHSLHTHAEAAECPDGRAEPMRVLVVDDEQIIADTLTRILNMNGFAATAFYSGEAALAALPSICPNIVLTDVRMPGRNGIETGIQIRSQCPETRVVLFSGQAGVGDLMDEARQNGYGFELWPKPLHPRELVRRLRELIS